MKKLAAIKQPELNVTNFKERAITTSRNLAEVFGKRHDNVLRDISNLECSSEFRLLNFEESKYKNEQNKSQPQYLITKDGFTMLAFGFSGKEAFKFKEAYIKKFNTMENLLQQKQSIEWKEARTNSKLYQHDLGDTIKKFVEYAISQGSNNAKFYYTSINTLSNKVVDIKNGNRDFAEARKLQIQTFVMDLIKATLEEEMTKGTPYKNVYKSCKEKISNFMQYVQPVKRIAN